MSENQNQSKYGAILNKARQSTEPELEVKLENHKKSKPENQKKVKQERMVNVGAKVPESYRNHWAAEAKRNRRSMTDVIISALTDAFGLPPEE